MKTCIQHLVLLPALIACLGLILVAQVTAQTFTKLHSFTPVNGPYNINSDGAYTYNGLILLSNTLYGTSNSGGSSGWGTVFKLNTDGTGFTTLHSFIEPDGDYPYGSLILSGRSRELASRSVTLTSRNESI